MMRHRFFLSGIISLFLWLLSDCSHSQVTDQISPIVPVAVIVCEASHFSAEAAEQQLTLPLESALSRLNVTSMYSESSAGRSVITLYATKLSDEDRLALPSLLRTDRLPEGIVPQVYLPSSSRSSLHYVLKSSTLKDKALGNWHREEFASRLCMQSGVEEVYTLGNIRHTVQVVPRLREMNARKITLIDIAAALDEATLYGIIPPANELAAIQVKNVNDISYPLSEIAAVSTRNIAEPVSVWENGIRVQAGVVFFRGEHTAAEMEQKLRDVLLDAGRNDMEIVPFYTETKSTPHSPATLMLTLRVPANSSQHDREKLTLAASVIIQADRSVARVVVENGFSAFSQVEEMHRLRAIIEIKEGFSADSVKEALSRELAVSDFSDFYIQTSGVRKWPAFHTLYALSSDRDEAIRVARELVPRLAGEDGVSSVYTSGESSTLTRSYYLQPQNVTAYGLGISQATELLQLAEGKIWKTSNNMYLELIPLISEKIDFLDNIHFFLPEQVIPLNRLTLLSLKKGPSVLLRFNRQPAVRIDFEARSPQALESLQKKLHGGELLALPGHCKIIFKEKDY